VSIRRREGVPTHTGPTTHDHRGMKQYGEARERKRGEYGRALVACNVSDGRRRIKETIDKTGMLCVHGGCTITGGVIRCPTLIASILSIIGLRLDARCAFLT